MDRDFLEKRKKDLNAYLQVTILSMFTIQILKLFYFSLDSDLTLRVCVPVATEPRDGESLPNSHSLRLWFPRKQGLQQGQRRVCTKGHLMFLNWNQHFAVICFLR